MPLSPTAVYDIGAALRNCACAALTTAEVMAPDCCGGDNPAGRVFVTPGGQVAWDACCEPCGQLSVTLLRLYETDSPGSAAQVVGPDEGCARWVVAEWEVLWITCVSVLQDDGIQVVFPDPAVLDAEARQLLTAQWSMWSGLRCCIQGWNDDYASDWSGWIAQSLPVGPEGGCAGASVTVATVVGPACDCREPAPPPPD